MFRLCNGELHLGSQTAEDFIDIKQQADSIHLHSATSYYKLALKYIEKYEPGWVKIYSNISGLDEVEISPALWNKQGKLSKEWVEGGRNKFVNYAFKSLKNTDSKHLKYLCIPEWSLLMAFKELKTTNEALENVVKINAWPVLGFDLNYSIDQKILIIRAWWPNIQDICLWISKIDIKENWKLNINAAKDLEHLSVWFVKLKHNWQIQLDNWIIIGFDGNSIFSIKSEKSIIMSSAEDIVFSDEQFTAILYPKSLNMQGIKSEPIEVTNNVLEFSKTLNQKKCASRGCIIICNKDIRKWNIMTQQNIEDVQILKSKFNFELWGLY